MPRPFTPDESDHIRSRLRAVGAEAFAQRGLRGTTVDDLARAAGISKGAFYRFYDSKEALLIVLLDDYETAAHAEIEAAVRADPHGGIEYLIDSAVHALQSHPLLTVLMSEEGLRVLRTATPEQQTRLLDRDVRLVRRVVSVLRDVGVEPVVPERVLLGLLRSLVFAGLHREDIGPDLLDEVSGWLKTTLRTALRPVTSTVTGPVAGHVPGSAGR
jgi:AcrR family transcriptional regulator